MEEKELDLIREFVVLSYVIMDVVSELKRMEKRPQVLQSFVISVCKDFGRRVRDKQQETRQQLQVLRISPRIIDEAGDGVVIVVTRQGQPETRYRIKRYVLEEQVEKRIAELSELWGNIEIDEQMRTMPWVPTIASGDPFAKGGN